jgi:phosphoribosylanthranilate isomerase
VTETSRTRIKICGITTPADVAAAVAAGADAIGIVRAERSPRLVPDERLDELLAAIPAAVLTVGVYLDPDPDRVLADGRRPVGDVQQLHGEVEAFVTRAGGRLVRALPFEADAVRRADARPEYEALLVDGPRPGSGAAFDHAALAAIMPALRKPVLLAGGLTPRTVAAAIRTVRPRAVDVSSGVESAPGVKDPARIRAFCDAVRAVDAELAAG